MNADMSERASSRQESSAALLGRMVKARRAKLNLRQDQLAELAGCSTRFVHTLENGKTTLQMQKVLDVLEVLGLGLQLVRTVGIGVSPELASVMDPER